MKKTVIGLLLALGIVAALGQATGRFIAQWQNAGTLIGTFTSFMRMNCSTGLTCTYSGGTVTITASGGSAVETRTAANSAALNFTTCLTNSAYKVFEVSVYGYVPATDATNARIQFSTDGGGTYDATSGHYMWSNDYAKMESASAGQNQSAADVAIPIFGGGALSSSATPALVSRFRIYNPASSTQGKFVTGDATATISGGNHYLDNFAGNYTQTTAVTAFRIIQDSGNITVGTASCYGITP